jgi:hypothetical protein
MLTIVPCPQCGVPAEITERFSLPSTDGPVAHVMMYCAAGLHFRMAAEHLPAARSEGTRDATRPFGR